MKTTYLIWRDPACNGVNPEWQEISGKEFITLVRSPEAKGRYFIKLPSTNGDGSDDTIVVEATQASYLEWRSARNHADYIRSCGRDTSILSYHAMESEDGECFGEELLRDEGCDVEDEYFANLVREEISAAVMQLTAKEQDLIHFLYLSDKQGTERGYSELTGIPQKTINDRKNRALAKLLKILSKKSAQTPE